MSSGSQLVTARRLRHHVPALRGAAAGPAAGVAPVSGGEANDTRNPLRVRLKPDPVWAFLEERDISQNELARLVGISSGYLPSS